MQEMQQSLLRDIWTLEWIEYLLFMIIVKYKGEVIDIKDIEITWTEYGVLSDNDVNQRTGSLAEFGQSHYSDGYDEGYNEGYDEGYHVFR